MKRLISLVVLSGTASNAFAADGGDGGSGMLLWGFLVFCAFVVAVQVIPSLMVMFGIAKGVAGQADAAQEEKVTTSCMGSE